MQRFAFFVFELKFEDTQPNSIANTVLNEIHSEFKNKLDKLKNSKLNFFAA